MQVFKGSSPITVIFLYFVLGLVLASAIHFHNLLILYPSQRQLLQSIELGFLENGGLVDIADFNIDGGWDALCIIPAYAFGKRARDIEQIRAYLGPNYQYSFFATPNPYDSTFGVGFAFLEDGNLQQLIILPSSSSIRVPRHAAPRGRKSDRLHFSDLNVRRKQPGQSCYGRNTGFIQFNSYQDITIGG